MAQTILGPNAVSLPIGTDAERPSSPTEGMIRYNTDSGEIETYDGTSWGSVGGAGVLKLSITSNQTNLDLRAYAFSNGWDGFSPLEVTIESGVIISSDSASVSAVNYDYPNTNSVVFINKGTIVGSGGNGGNAFSNGQNAADGLRCIGGTLYIDNQGTIAGGGGGGGGAGNDGKDRTNGGGGGGRTSLFATSGGTGADGGSDGEDGSFSSAGSGGSGTDVGGDGGNWGASGGTGGGLDGGSGGSGGASIVGNNQIFFINTGTRIGAIQS